MLPGVRLNAGVYPYATAEQHTTDSVRTSPFANHIAWIRPVFMGRYGPCTLAVALTAAWPQAVRLLPANIR